MNTALTYTPFKTVAQLYYGVDEYGVDEFACAPNDTVCTIEVGAPNTGFLGMSQSAAIATTAGALLVAVAIVGIIFIFVSRSRRRKHTQGE